MNINFNFYDEIDKTLMALSSPGIHPGLERVSHIMALLGNPEKSFPSIHVVGSNGKGSTSSMICSVLRQSGYRTAIYTSPHLVHFGERLTVNGIPIPPEEWKEEIERLFRLASSDSYLSKDMPTYFEAMTSVAFSLIAKNSVDVAVIEAGMGGRLDATNLLGDVKLSVITPIAMDHSDYLGNTLEEIASEKFAVVRHGGEALFSCEDHKNLAKQFNKICEERSANGEVVDTSELIFSDDIGLNGTTIHFKDQQKERDIFISLIGKYQARNGLLAYRACQKLIKYFPKITPASIEKGLSNVKWPGRFDIIKENPLTIVDGAHNPHGMRALVETASNLFKNKKIAIVFTSMADKDYDSVMKTLKDGINCDIFCTSVPENSRCEKALTLSEKANLLNWEGLVKTFEDPIEALRVAQKDYDVVICCGSLYLVAWIYRYGL